MSKELGPCFGDAARTWQKLGESASPSGGERGQVSERQSDSDFLGGYKAQRLRFLDDVIRSLPDDAMRRVMFLPGCGAPMCLPTNRGGGSDELDKRVSFASVAGCFEWRRAFFLGPWRHRGNCVCVCVLQPALLAEEVLIGAHGSGRRIQSAGRSGCDRAWSGHAVARGAISPASAQHRV